MIDMVIPFPVLPKLSPLSRGIELQRTADRFEFAAYAAVGMSTVSALVMNLTSRGILGDTMPAVVAMAERIAGFMGLA
jgi:hypothetical protein